MDEDWILIQKALENPKFKWRTVNGIAKETGIEPFTIVNSLSNHSDLVIQSSVPSTTGEELFTTREHYMEKSSALDRVMSSIKNKVE